MLSILWRNSDHWKLLRLFHPRNEKIRELGQLLHSKHILISVVLGARSLGA